MLRLLHRTLSGRIIRLQLFFDFTDRLSQPYGYVKESRVATSFLTQTVTVHAASTLGETTGLGSRNRSLDACLYYIKNKLEIFIWFGLPQDRI
jgi:hypothetical protein